MSKKLCFKIICCICAVVLTKSNVGAFSLFPSNNETKLESAKLLYDKSIESLEESKTECQNLFDDLGSVLSEAENSRVELKSCLKELEEQFKKLNIAYSAWSVLGYAIKGPEYEAYCAAKDDFEKVVSVYRLKKELFVSYCKKLECLLGSDSKSLGKYESGTNDSINLYYNYGIALAKNNSKNS